MIINYRYFQGYLSWADNSYFWKSKKFDFHTCHKPGVNCKFCVSFQKSKLCKMDRDYTSRTFVEIYFNWDYFKMKKVLLIDEQKLKIVFNGTGLIQNVRFAWLSSIMHIGTILRDSLSRRLPTIAELALSNLLMACSKSFDNFA